MASSKSSGKKTRSKKSNSILLWRGSWFRKGVKAIWIALLSGIIVFYVYILAVDHDFLNLFGGMPSTRSIENPENDLSSELISADGVSLGKYYRYASNRSQVTYDQLSADLVNTLLYSEDHRFYDHSGLDPVAFIRAIKGVVTGHSGVKGGGSTLSQQLAKNLFRTRGKELEGRLTHGGLFKTIVFKTKEWIIAVRLEQNFTKEEIIAMYLNTVSFGSSTFGIKVASETYFGKTPDQLNIPESSVLVGMLQGNNTFDPIANPKNALSKRNQVLAKLLDHEYIKNTEYDSLRQTPIPLKYRFQNQNVGLATYFRTVIQGDLMIWAKDHNLDLMESGLKIFTTLDSRMQRYAEDAVTESMRAQQKKFNDHWKGRNPWIDENKNEIKGYLDSQIKRTDAYRNLVKLYGKGDDSVRILLKLKKRMKVFTWKGERDTLFSSMDSLNYYKHFLNAGFMSMDPTTGAVRAWVGGINYKYFKFDHVRQSKRQPGSLFKAFVYGTAMEQDYPPCQKFQDISPTFKLAGNATWSPANAGGDRGSGEWFTLRQALAKSLNSITAQLLQKVGEQNVVSFAHRAGVSSKLDAVPSLCLGVSDCSLYELVGAYSTFVNAGNSTKPFYITRIEDKNGNVIQNFVPETKQGMNEQTAYKMLYMLMGGVEEIGGTSNAIPAELKSDNEIGGKTGTTNDASDGWYMGVTHNLVSGAWVGGDDRSIHYRNWTMGSGGETARPIWVAYMKRIYADKTLQYKKGVFKQPANGIDVTLRDCSKYNSPDPQLKDDKNWEDPNN